MECQECGEEWKLGIPIGESNMFDDLWCESCDDSWMLIHRVVPRTPGRPPVPIAIHLKCPNCYHFDKTERQTDQDGVALIGYPVITGDTENAEEPHGWNRADSADCGESLCNIHGDGTLACPNRND